MDKFTSCLIFAEGTSRTSLTCSSGVHLLLSDSILVCMARTKDRVHIFFIYLLLLCLVNPLPVLFCICILYFSSARWND